LGGDLRWVNRGAYDLMGTSSAKKGVTDIPEGVALFDTIPKQLKDGTSYASQVKVLLDARKKYNVTTGKVGADLLPLADGFTMFPISFPSSPFAPKTPGVPPPFLFVMVNWKDQLFSQNLQLGGLFSSIESCQRVWPGTGPVSYSQSTRAMKIEVGGYSSMLVYCNQTL